MDLHVATIRRKRTTTTRRLVLCQDLPISSSFPTPGSLQVNLIHAEVLDVASPQGAADPKLKFEL